MLKCIHGHKSWQKALARRLEQIAVDPESLWEDPDLNKLAA